MKQYAIIGLSRFGQRILDELSEVDCEILIMDKDPEIIENMKDKATNSFIANVINEDTINKLIPANIDAAIIDLGERLEASVLVTNYLKKMGVQEIIVKAETDEHAEILKIVGATQIVFPNREAAKRIVPGLVSSMLFNYLPISNGLVIAEVKVPEKYAGMSLIEADLRRRYGLNVIAIREQESDYRFFDPEHKLSKNDVFLVAGSEEIIASFSGKNVAVKKKGFGRLLRNFFSRTGS
jgi:trk system potassium uptake protein